MTPGSKRLAQSPPTKIGRCTDRRELSWVQTAAGHDHAGSTGQTTMQPYTCEITRHALARSGTPKAAAPKPKGVQTPWATPAATDNDIVPPPSRRILILGRLTAALRPAWPSGGGVSLRGISHKSVVAILWLIATDFMQSDRSLLSLC